MSVLGFAVLKIADGGKDQAMLQHVIAPVAADPANIAEVSSVSLGLQNRLPIHAVGNGACWAGFCMAVDDDCPLRAAIRNVDFG